MKYVPQLIVCFLLILTCSSYAQELALYRLSVREKNNQEKVGFASFSDNHPLSDHPDSLAIPDLTDTEIGDAAYFTLDPEYRKRFLHQLHFSETDSVFVYNYAADRLRSFTVKDLDVAASLSLYTDTESWPYSQYDYMIGLEISSSYLKGFGEYFSETLVYVGKENPFVRGKLKPVRWKKMKSGEVPSEPSVFVDTSQQGEYTTGDACKYEAEGYRYIVRDLLRDNQVAARRLVVTDLKTNETVCEKIYYVDEGSSLTPLNFIKPDYNKEINQWTGNLFKNKPPVIFGFQYHSFGCPGIAFLKQSEKEIYINCDNRH